MRTSLLPRLDCHTKLRSLTVPSKAIANSELEREGERECIMVPARTPEYRGRVRTGLLDRGAPEHEVAAGLFAGRCRNGRAAPSASMKSLTNNVTSN